MIIYVLQNNLEDKPVFENGKICGFMTISEAATKFEVGEGTVNMWINLGWLNTITVGDTKFIPAISEKPIARNTSISARPYVAERYLPESTTVTYTTTQDNKLYSRRK